jgi:WD40 repeat protein
MMTFSGVLGYCQLVRNTLEVICYIAAAAMISSPFSTCHEVRVGWYVHRNGKRIGPVNPQELKAMASRGQLAPTDYVWKEGMKDWLRADQVKGLFTPVVSPATLPPPLNPGLKRAAKLEVETESESSGSASSYWIKPTAWIFGIGIFLMLICCGGIGLLRSKNQERNSDQVGSIANSSATNHGSHIEDQRQVIEKPQAPAAKTNRSMDGLITTLTPTRNNSSEPLAHIAHLNSGKTLVGTRSNEVLFWDLETGKSKQTMDTAGKFISDLKFSADEKMVAILSSAGELPEDLKMVRVCDVRTGEEKGFFSNRNLDVAAVMFSQDGSLVYGYGGDNGITNWRHDSNSRDSKIDFKGLECVLSNDLKTLLAHDSKKDGCIYIYDMQTKEQVLHEVLKRKQEFGMTMKGFASNFRFSDDGQACVYSVSCMLIAPQDYLVIHQVGETKSTKRFDLPANHRIMMLGQIHIFKDYSIVVSAIEYKEKRQHQADEILSYKILRWDSSNSQWETISQVKDGVHELIGERGKTIHESFFLQKGEFVELYDCKGKLMDSYPVANCSDAALAPDGNSVALGTSTGEIEIWKVKK